MLQSQTARDLIVSLPGGSLVFPLFYTDTIAALASVTTSHNALGGTYSPNSGSHADLRLLETSLIVHPQAGTSTIDTTATVLSVNIEANTGAGGMGFLRGVTAGANWNVAGQSVAELRAIEAICYAQAGTVTEADGILIRQGSTGMTGTMTRGVPLRIDPFQDPTPTNYFPIWQVDTRGNNILAAQLTVGKNSALAVATATMEVYQKTPAANFTGLYLGADSPEVLYSVRWKNPGAAGVNLLGTDKVLVLV